MLQSIGEYTSLRGTGKTWQNQIITPTTPNLLSDTRSDQVELIAEFKAGAATATEFGIKVRTGPAQYTAVGYDRSTARMYVDRTHSGLVPNPSGTQANPDWPGRHNAPLAPVDGTVTLRIFVDRSLVEVFGNEREQISDRILPDRTGLSLETYAIGGEVGLTSLRVYPLRGIWPTDSPVTVEGVSGWTTVCGGWADTQTGKQGSAHGNGFLLSDRTGSDLTLSADITVIGAQDGNPEPIKEEAAGGLLFRADDTATEGYVATIDAQDDSVRLYRRNSDGSTTTLGHRSTPLKTNTTYRLKAAAKGSRIRIHLDGSLVIDATDSAYRGGRSGLNVRDAAVEFDHIEYANTTDFATNLTGWKPRSGTWRYTANGAAGCSAADGYLMSATTAKDLVYQADITVSEAGEQPSASLVFRANADASQGYGVSLDPGDDAVTLSTSDSAGRVIARHATPLETGRTYRLRAEANGQHIRILLDDALVITASDTTYDSGALGLQVHDSTATFQNVVLWRTPAQLHGVSGTWTKAADGWRGESSGDGFALSSESATDVSYQADVCVSGSDGGRGAAALVFRANSDVSRGYVANVDARNDVVTLFRFNGDGSATVLKRHCYSIDADRTYRLAVRARGSGIRVYLDGRKMIDTEDGAFQDGLLGLNTWDSRATFRNVSFTPLR